MTSLELKKPKPCP